MNVGEYRKMFALEERNWWYIAKRMLLFKLLSKYNHVKAPKILDAGCGTGVVVQKLSRYFDTVGIDYSKEALKFCKDRGLKNVKFGNVMKLGFKSNTFDVVTSFDVIYHQGVIDDVKALSEFYRVLKPGGILILTDSAFKILSSSHDLAVHAKRRYNKKELRAKMIGAGFRVEKLSYYYFTIFIPVLIVRLLKKILPSKESDMVDSKGFVNRFMIKLMNIESTLLKKMNFPFGVSVIAVGRKNE